METQNLWPDFAIEPIRSPKTILKEQAGYLMAKTNNVLSAAVETSHYKENISHEFYVVAPALNNYRYRLFSVSHEVVGYYPVTISSDFVHHQEHEQDNDTDLFYTLLKAKDEQEFILLLSNVFKNPENVRVISLFSLRALPNKIAKRENAVGRNASRVFLLLYQAVSGLKSYVEFSY